MPKVDIFSEAENVSNSGKSTSINEAEILQKPMLSGPEKIAMRGAGDLDPLLISKTIRNDIVYMVENQKRGPEAIEDYVERRLNDLYKLSPRVAWDTQFQLHGTVLNAARVPIAQTFPNSVLHLKFDRTNLRWQAEVTPFAPVFDGERRAMMSNGDQSKSRGDRFEQFRSKLEFVDKFPYSFGK
ncbi:MAG: hypothetical protein IAF58_19880 [Leptolyngbya sp.]|nr:hypothetical protein [Candidatus Melainabacteria bacterium]